MQTRLDEHDTARAANRIALTMIVTFLLTCAGLYWKQKAAEAPAPATPSMTVAQPAQAPPRAPPEVPPPTRPGSPLRAATSAALSGVVAPSAEEQPTDEQPSVVPVVLRLRYFRRENRFEGSIKSLSATALNIILVGKNHEGDETARISIVLAPFESKPFGTDDGMELESGGQVFAQSQGYQDRPASIP
jgi:hypothetical protein